MSTADQYRRFAEAEARGESTGYERLAMAVAADAGLIELLDRLPPPKRQPNLLFAAAQYLGGPVADPVAFRAWARTTWADLSTTMLVRRTQTNEPNRCAALLPVLARLPQPLALLEVGASAGLCLYPDAYHYDYGGGRQVGPAESPVRLTCAAEDRVPIPAAVPTVVWRAGLDLNPLDVASDDDLRWLDALIWPEQPHRRERLHAAAAVARADPPRIERGDLLTDLPALAAQAPAGATLVVFHTAVLSYVDAVTRSAFADLVTGLPGHWVANEGVGVLPGLAVGLDLPPDDAARFLIALDGRPVALARPHGQALHWLADAS